MTNIAIWGNLSGGKSVLGVRTCFKNKHKKRIISNIKLRMAYEYLSMKELIDFLLINMENEEIVKAKFNNSILFLDEMTNLIDARKSTTNLNELITKFLMMCGKMDCDVIYTCQVLGSQIDLRLREVTNIFCNCVRINQYGKPIIFKNRVLNEKIYIKVTMLINLEAQGYKATKFVFNPDKYYWMYDTRELVMLDRIKFLKSK